MVRSSYLTPEGELIPNLTFPNGSVYPNEDDSGHELWQWDDATWILAASFIIFTMQTGWNLNVSYYYFLFIKCGKHTKASACWSPASSP